MGCEGSHWLEGEGSWHGLSRFNMCTRLELQMAELDPRTDSAWLEPIGRVDGGEARGVTTGVDAAGRPILRREHGERERIDARSGVCREV